MISWTERFYFLFYCNSYTLKNATFFFLKAFVCDSQDTLQEIETLIDRLCARDEKIAQISIWLEGSLEGLRYLYTVEIPGKLPLKSFQ